MKPMRMGIIAATVFAATLAAGCGGEGSDIVEGDETFNDVGGEGGTGGSGSGDGSGDDSGSETPPPSDTSGVDPAANGGYRGGGGFTAGGFLLDRNVHPLRSEIDSSFTGGSNSRDAAGDPITPATPAANQSSCPEGTVDGNPNTTQSVAIFNGTPEFPVCVIRDDFTAGDSGSASFNLTADHVYLLINSVRVGNGNQPDIPRSQADQVELDIESGTQIFAQSGGAASVRVTRGSDININGTRERPVLLTAVAADNQGNITGNPANFTGLGEWGGVIIDGYAPTNESDNFDGGNGSNDVPNEILSEAAPPSQENYFGGDLPTDSSGSISFAVIGETGFAFVPDEEVQGLTLEGVGSGTTIENLQVFNSDDDGIEWFGGTVNLTNLVVHGMSDDGLDIDQGYAGTISKAIVRQGAERGDRTSEADGNGSGFDSTPVTRPNLANVLLFGDGDGESVGLRMREGYGADFENIVVTDADALTSINNPGAAFGNGCFRNTDEVDRDLTALGIAFNCANDVDGGVPGEAQGGGFYASTWSQGMFDEGSGGAGSDTGTGNTPNGFNATEHNAMTVNGQTYVVDTSVQPFDGGGDSDFVAADYLGAVDPTKAQANNEFFRGWIISVAAE